MFLIDTNVISEIRKARAGKIDRNVRQWARSIDPSLMYLSVITIHEIEIGIQLTERRDPEQGSLYRSWLENEVIPVFESRLLPLTLEIARASAAYHVPDPASANDAYIGATAQAHGLIVVTRNTADFRTFGVRLLNPWNAH